MGLKAVATSAASLDTQPVTLTRRYRGITYRLYELDILAYDKIEKQATSEGPIDLNGQPSEKIDGVLRSRLLLQATCVDPRLTMDQIVHMPFKLGNTLMRDVNDLYFTFEDPETDPDAEDDGKGEG